MNTNTNRFNRLHVDAMNPENSANRGLTFIAIEDTVIPSLITRANTENAKYRVNSFVTQADSFMSKLGDQISQGLNDFGNQLNSLIDTKNNQGQQGHQEQDNTGTESQTDGTKSTQSGFGESSQTSVEMNTKYEPVTVKTGVGINLSENEVLYIYSPARCGLNLINNMYFNQDTRVGSNTELTISMCNTLPVDVIIHKGDVIAYGVIIPQSKNSGITLEKM